MLAVLEDAIACYQKYLFARDIKGKALFQEAEEWVGEAGAANVFSFDSVCETLGLNPDYLRRGLENWRKSVLAQHTHAKVYQLKPTARKQGRRVALSRRSARRLRRATGR